MHILFDKPFVAAVPWFFLMFFASFVDSSGVELAHRIVDFIYANRDQIKSMSARNFNRLEHFLTPSSVVSIKTRLDFHFPRLKNGIFCDTLPRNLVFSSLSSILYLSHEIASPLGFYVRNIENILHIYYSSNIDIEKALSVLESRSKWPRKGIPAKNRKWVVIFNTLHSKFLELDVDYEKFHHEVDQIAESLLLMSQGQAPKLNPTQFGLKIHSIYKTGESLRDLAEQSIRQLWGGLNKGKEAAPLVTTENANITRLSVLKLLNDKELDDEIINGYFDLLKQSKAAFWSQIIAVNSLQFIVWGRENSKTPKTLLFREGGLVLIPLHEKARGHWTLVAINAASKKIFYFDSAGSEAFPEDAKRIIKRLYENQTKGPMDPAWRFAISGSMPRQTTGVDCGVFVCQMAKHLVFDEEVTFFDDRDIPRIRLELFLEIVSKKMLY